MTALGSRMRELGIGEIPVVVGGIIPPEDAKELLAPAWRASTRRRTTRSRIS